MQAGHILIVLCLALLTEPSRTQRLGYLRVPVADLRSTPTPLGMSFAHSDAEQSQLLWLDPVEIGTDAPLSSLSWVPVAALRQPTYNATTGQWQPYPGLVQADQIAEFKGYPLAQPSLAVVAPWARVFAKPCHMVGCLPHDQLLSVSFGTLLYTLADSPVQGWWEIWRPTSTEQADARAWILAADVARVAAAPADADVRAQLPARADWLLGYLYLWGGRSAFSAPLYSAGAQLTGFDCSGLVSTLYQSFGLIIPRDASKQAMVADPLATVQSMQVGDLFFYADAATGFVYHVMMYYSTQPPSLVESSTNSTRVLTLEQAFGVPYDKISYGMLLFGNSILTFGSVLPYTPSKWAYSNN